MKQHLNGKGLKRPAKGVTRLPSGRYRTRVSVNKRRISLGTYDTLKEAMSAYDNFLHR
jgi:hypothetical protein